MRLLQFLEEYIKEHFAAEERLQLRNAYPEYTEHKSQHMRFISDVARLKEAFKADGATLSLVIMTNKTLVSWLVQHIAKTDMELARYLREERDA